MKILPPAIIKMHIAVAIMIGFIVYAASAVKVQSVIGVFLAIGVSSTIFLFLIEKYIARFINLRNPFPQDWRNILADKVSFYGRLSLDDQKRFEKDVQIFLNEQRIYAVRGQSVSDEIKVLIAASAATLGFGLPDWEWPDLRDILVYPSGFDEEYSIHDGKPIRGMVHQQGPIIFSESDLKMGYVNTKSGYNVGLHEMAHVLDMANGNPDGVPVGMDWVVTAPWVRVMADRIQKVRRGECKKILREYAGVDEAEFFAVAVEVFFQRPVDLAESDPELFELLKSYFRINPIEPTVS